MDRLKLRFCWKRVHKGFMPHVALRRQRHLLTSRKGTDLCFLSKMHTVLSLLEAPGVKAGVRGASISYKQAKKFLSKTRMKEKCE